MWQRNEHGGSRAVSRHGTHRGVKILVRADLAAPCSTGRRLLLERAIELACLHGASGMAPPRKPDASPLPDATLPLRDVLHASQSMFTEKHLSTNSLLSTDYGIE